MPYKHDLITILDNFRSWVQAGTISQMQVGPDTKLTINADNSKLHFSYTSGTQQYQGSLKLTKKY